MHGTTYEVTSGKTWTVTLGYLTYASSVPSQRFRDDKPEHGDTSNPNSRQHVTEEKEGAC